MGAANPVYRRQHAVPDRQPFPARLEPGDRGVAAHLASASGIHRSGDDGDHHDRRFHADFPVLQPVSEHRFLGAVQRRGSADAPGTVRGGVPHGRHGGRSILQLLPVPVRGEPFA
ncbi:hypothetical protein SDC9_203556 [bioreactor metagenome]|uniref:Uncharacterized protein n=1 Tax=bioreactor metagenome TaxID=1076179 RepID=A0A645IYD6_9ZZZZ